MSKPAALTALTWIVLSCIGCSSDSSSPTKTCLPGEQRACACPAGNSGFQVCSDDGKSLGECTSCGAVANAGGATTITGGATTMSGTGGVTVASGGSGIGGGSTPGGSQTAALNGGSTNANTTASVGGVHDSMGGAATGSGGVASITGGTSSGNTQVGGTLAAGGVSTTIDPSLGGTSGVTTTASGGVGTGGTTVGGSTSSAVAGQPSTGGSASTGGASVVSQCGDGTVTGSEGCDPAQPNNDLGDGCTPACRAEPACPPTSGTCVSTCGDSIVGGTETCDDGNAVGGDGCSATCMTEPGFSCATPQPGASHAVPLVVRDFNTGADFEKGAFFATGLTLPTQGLLKSTLDGSGLKPELQSTSGTYDGKADTDSGIASAASFGQWYSDSATGPNSYHSTLVTSLNLYSMEGSDPPMYTNRYGNNGDGLTSTRYQRTTGLTDHFCGDVGREDHDANGNAIPCTYCAFDQDPSTPQCDPKPVDTYCSRNPGYKCVQSNNQWFGVYIKTDFDGNPLFFPADAITKPWSPDYEAQIPGNYDPAWPNDPVSGRTHNFSFTSEARFWFKYDAAQTYVLEFEGDDDAWVFVNKHLALDIGGIHTPVLGRLTISNGQASAHISNTYPPDDITTTSSTPSLGTLQDGGIYEVVVFQAERQSNASSYRLSISANFAASPSVCTPL